jgi:sulfoxide reductase heme-binding subunit YedZ
MTNSEDQPNYRRARPHRLRYRVLAHHLPLLLASGLCVAFLYDTRTYTDVLSRASFATAYPALLLLTATLAIGPWNVLRGRRNPISSDLRRDVGIWAGILGVLHTVVGQNVHLRGRPWLYYVYEKKSLHTFPIRHDLFGFANYTGAAAVLALMALSATSNDYALRALGTPQWKKLQQWNYALFALAATHAIAYQVSEKQQISFVATTVFCIIFTAFLQTAGFFTRKVTRASASKFRGSQT